jgi:ribose transport system substrate-binding protein
MKEKEKKMKKVLVILLVVGLIFCLASMGILAEKADYTGKIGISLPTATHGYMGRVNWWVQKAVKDWKAKNPALEFLVVTADSVTKQAADIEDLMTKEIDAIVVFPFDASVTSVIEQAYKKGIYTVVLDRGTTKPVYDVYISNDDEGYTREGTEWIAKELGYKGKMVIIEGIPCPINTTRIDTIKATAAKYPGIEILDSQPGEWNQEKALAVMENYLQKYPQIDAVYTADDDMMKGALQAYKESGRSDIKIFLGGGASKEMLQKIMDGDKLVRANVTYPPDCIATAIGLAVLGYNKQTFEGFYQKKLPLRIILSAELITAENAADYYNPDEVN